MEPLLYWGISLCLFMLAGLVMVVALLQMSMGRREKNARLAELIWQSRSRNTDWWLRADKHGGLTDEDQD